MAYALIWVIGQQFVIHPLIHGDSTMTTFASIAAVTLLFAGQAVANPEFDNHDSYGSVLNDTVAAQGGASYQPTGYLVAVTDSADSYGSVLYDLDQPAEQATVTQPGIGDSADDFGSILYDTGSVY